MTSEPKDIIKRIEKLEKAVFGPKKIAVAKSSKAAGANTLADQILHLRSSGFFKSPKTAPEVHAKLQTTYPCEPNRVAVALLRLRNKKGGLRITSKEVGGKKLKAYVG